MNNNNGNKIIKVALYARVSTEEQKENFSLASQLELLRKHAFDNKYIVHDEYVDDGYSGTSFERPQFQRLMEDARQDKLQLILVYRVDRFFRNNKNLLNTVDELQRFGVSIRSITEPFDTSNYLGKFVLSLFGSIAELERNTFLQRSRDGRLRRAREGYYSGSSPTRFGYIYHKETKEIKINEKEAEVVKLIYELYNQPDSSLIKVTRKLRTLGYKTKEGHLMREDVVHDILKDTIYIGKWHANKHDSKTGGLKPVEEWIEVKVPQMISEEAFLKAQEYLNNRRNYSERNAKYHYLLQGLVKCGDCGNTIAGTADKQFQEKNGRKYGPYFKMYYRCTHFVKNKFEKLVKCRLKYVQAGKLEDAVWNQVEKIFQNPYLIEHAIKNREEVKSMSRETAQKEIARISLMQESLTKEEQRILEAYRQSIITIEQLKEQIDSLRKTRENLERTRQDLRLSLNESDKKAEVKHAVDFIEKIKKEFRQFNYEAKKQALKLLNTSVKVNVSGIIDIDCFVPRIPSPSEQEFLSYFDSARPIF
ncbi:MAG: recombinase family protein [Candidatus Omnitrophota bacterium]|nr:recombinase family protein [Candidatus Omnitrophota bacterium]